MPLSASNRGWVGPGASRSHPHGQVPGLVFLLGLALFTACSRPPNRIVIPVIYPALRDAAVAPDSSSIAFIRVNAAPSDTMPGGLYILDLISHKARLVWPGDASDPSWSHDASRLVFSSSGLHIYDLRTGTTTLLTAYQASQPCWAPSGDSIAFVTTHGDARGRFRICIIRTDGSGFRDISSLGGTAYWYWPSWSPDARRIAHARFEADGLTHLYVMSTDGTGGSRISAETQQAATPSWCPDSTLIAYVRQPLSQPKVVCLVDPDGGQSTPVIQAQDPAWWPDGHSLVVSQIVGNYQEEILIRVSLSGQVLQPIHFAVAR
jgi:Tol biopolymer transport system component